MQPQNTLQTKETTKVEGATICGTWYYNYKTCNCKVEREEGVVYFAD